MSRVESICCFALLLAFPSRTLAGPVQPAQPQSSAAGASSSVILPAGTRVELLLTRPVWSIAAKAGDQIYAQTSFPVVAANAVAIPAGTYVEGTIENVTRPTRRTNRAEIDVLFTKIVFANGYVISLPAEPAQNNPTANNATPSSAPADPGKTLIAITIQVTTANDLLLDNGAQVEMTLGAPLALDAGQIARALPLSHTPQPGLMKSASQCAYIPGTPGTPGTPDMVIPGSPGTPDTTIPGGPGMPDTVIPGTPATPATVIPGTPGMPGTPGHACPPKPIVLSCAPVVRHSSVPAAQPVASR